MAVKLIQDTTLKNIADAIREKTETTESLKPAEMAEAILAIEDNTGSSEYEDIIVNLNKKYLTSQQAQTILETIASKGGSIGEYLFYHQYYITDLVIPNEIDFYSSSCFNCCYKLKNITLSEKTRQICDMAFSYTDIETITFPATLQSISTQAFRSCDELKTVYFKGTPNDIHKWAFDSCSNITDIYVPWGVNDEINENAPWGATKATIHYNYK